MPTSYTIVPIPRWYFADLVGRPLGGGYMATYRSLNKTIRKPIYTDASGSFAYPNPVFFDENGEAPGPFFWADDEPYFIQIFSADNLLLFTMDNYGPGISGGGGGGSTTVNNFLENFIVNNDYTSHGGTSVNVNNNDEFLNIQNGTVISPSNHHGLVKVATGFTTIPYAGPDVMFVRSNDSSTDNLAFSTADFNAGDVPLAGDVTPEYYIDLECTSAGSETLKAVQYPIVLHVKNLEQQSNISFLFWAKGFSGTQNLTVNLVQFFGTGSATTPVVTAIAVNASPLTNTWQAYNATFTIPSVAGKVLGAGGDDAVYIQICYPVGATFRIFQTKPKFYLANVPTVFPELQTYDYADRIINSPRTGDVRTSLNSYELNWVPANDGTIGSKASLSTTRKNIDTWPLYSLLWNTVLDHWAPVSTGRGASAIADFAANKTITLTRALGRVRAGLNGGLNVTSAFTVAALTDLLTVSSTANYLTGTPVQVTGLTGATPLAINTIYFVINISTTTLKLATTLDLAYAGTPIDITVDGSGTIQTALGAYFGESDHVLTIAEMPSHNHPGSTVAAGVGAGNSGFAEANQGAGQTHPVTVAAQGSGEGHNTIQPTTYLNVFFKL